ncbi:hypothetical protein GCM10022221_68200 [Actinocorallia aurea]
MNASDDAIEQILDVIRYDPHSGPALITVFCDRCGIKETADYLVHEEDSPQTRYGYARKHLRKRKGWTCDHRGDFCPACPAPADEAETDAPAAHGPDPR